VCVCCYFPLLVLKELLAMAKCLLALRVIWRGRGGRVTARDLRSIKKKNRELRRVKSDDCQGNKKKDVSS
jgi:hypothetical protein